MTIHADPCSVSYLDSCDDHRFAPKSMSVVGFSFIIILAWKNLGDFISCSFVVVVVVVDFVVVVVVVVCQSTEIKTHVRLKTTLILVRR